MSVYYATKSYVNSFTFSLIEESKNKNLNIILLTPGPTKTNFEGMNRELKGLEKFYVTSPEEVAKECFLGIKNKKTLIIPGFINKFLYLIDKFIPLNLKLKSIKKIQEKKLKK